MLLDDAKKIIFRPFFFFKYFFFNTNTYSASLHEPNDTQDLSPS